VLSCSLTLRTEGQADGRGARKWQSKQDSLSVLEVTRIEMLIDVVCEGAEHASVSVELILSD
jgi:hypothetical protein